MPGSARDQLLSKTGCLVLDGQDRSLYIGIHPNVMLLLAMEPVSQAPGRDEDEDDICDEEFEAKVKAANLEEWPIFKEEPSLHADKPIAISRAVLEDLVGR